MKKLLIIFLFIPFILNATTYYVAPSTATPAGNDANAGTIAAPWLTWGKAFTSTSVNAGDTVFFRGGVYTMAFTDGWGYDLTRSGTITDTLCYFNYPGEVPILDCSNVIPSGTKNKAITNQYLNTAVTYIKFRGLVVRNVTDDGTGPATVEADGWRVVGGNIVWENCTVYNIGGIGFYGGFNNTEGEHWWINCDAYNCNNPNAITPYLPGNRGVGFSAQNFYNTVGHSYTINCRAWNCGDQGFSLDGDQYCEMNGCWSFANGRLQGDGHGFKLGWVVFDSDSLRRKVVNCIAAYNRYDGFTSNDNLDARYPYTWHGHLYNNIAYKNGYYPGYNYGWGFMIYNNNNSDDASELGRDLRNNISYANAKTPVFVGTNALYTHVYNSWDTPPGVTLSDADFVSVDSTGISGARGADGSLPDLSGFLHLAEGSDLIAAGIGVGLIYDGDSLYWDQETPSLGAYEYGAVEPGPPPDYPAITTSSVSAKSILAYTGGTGLNDGMGTISAKGVCWSTSINPTISDSKLVTGSGTNDFTCTIRGLSSNTTYHVRSYVTNETGTTYGADISFTTPSSSPFSSPTGKIYVDGSGKIVTISNP